jgi:hypothetical protein
MQFVCHQCECFVQVLVAVLAFSVSFGPTPPPPVFKCVGHDKWEMKREVGPCLDQYFRWADAVAHCDGKGGTWDLPYSTDAKALLANLTDYEEDKWFPLIGNGGGTCKQSQLGKNTVYWLKDHDDTSGASAIMCTDDSCSVTGTVMGDVYYNSCRCIQRNSADCEPKSEYRCVGDYCVPGSPGIPKESCQKFCGRPPRYICHADECVVSSDAHAVPYDDCKKICF